MSNTPSDENTVFCRLLGDEIPQDRCKPAHGHERCKSCPHYHRKGREDGSHHVKQPLQISKELQDFIEAQFQEMCRNEGKLPKEREKDKRRRERERKQRARELDKDLKACARLRRRGVIRGDENKRVKKVRMANKKILENESKCNPLYGKSHVHFNNFAMRCYYLIKKETDKGDIEIFRWIAKFLEAKKYEKAKGGKYVANNIKQIVYNYFQYSEMKPYYKAFFDREYAKPLD
jgi:hypothetical protein